MSDIFYTVAFVLSYGIVGFVSYIAGWRAALKWSATYKGSDV